MASLRPSDDIFGEPFWIALVILVIAAGAILAALGFQHIGGYEPCALCLMQRTPYYIGIPVAAALTAAIWSGAPRRLVAAGFAALALLMLYNTGLAAYHSGVEWGWWEGPSSCAPSTSVGSAGAMLESLRSGARGPSCTEAVWRFLGLSFAGWNVLISLALAVLALLGVAQTARGYGSNSASQYR
jgi:disulfide bond formation protein DsbB